MEIADVVRLDRICIGLKAQEKKGIISELLDHLLQLGVITDLDGALAEFMDREAKGSTGIGNGIAIPHIRTHQVSQLEFMFANSKEGINFESLDGEPAHIIFMIMAPADSHGIHIKALARVSRILNDETVRIRLKNANTPEEVNRIIDEREDEIG
jgi:PTS system fructose-specific IIC component